MSGRRRTTSLLVAATTLVMVVGRPPVVEAQAPPATLPPVVGPIGADACETAGLVSILGGAVLGQGGLDPSAAQPVNDAVDGTCGAVPPAGETVACPVDSQVTNQVFAVPLPAGLPLPTPTPFGLTIEQMRAIAVLLSASPDTVDPIGDLLGCTTVPGLPGTSPPAPAPTGSVPVVPTTAPAPAQVASGPSATPARPAVAGPSVAAAPTAATTTASPTPASAVFPPIPGPLGTPAANGAFLVLALGLLGIAGWSWRRAGQNVSFR
jgi:hypothetical protein